MDKYCIVGNLFCLGKTGRTFSGPCVLGPDAVYLIVNGDSAKHQLDSGMRGIAGLMDKASGLVQMVPIPGLDRFEMSIAELVDQIGNDPDWPIEFTAEKAFVFPRRVIARMRFGPLAGLNFSPEGLFSVNVSSSFKQRTAGIAYLQQHGWPIDTRSFFDRIRGKAA